MAGHLHKNIFQLVWSVPSTPAKGGVSGNGTVFKINTNGTGFTILHNFTDSIGDGEWPSGSLTLYGSTLYGMTGSGGSDAGTVFKINTDGTGFTNYNFCGISCINPSASARLLLSGPLRIISG